MGKGPADVTVDGEPREEAIVDFPTDGSVRRVHVRLRQPRAEQTGGRAPGPVRQR